MPRERQHNTYNGICQELVICGLDMPKFSQSIKKIVKIHFFFNREFGENILEDTLKSQGNEPASTIEMLNCFLTLIAYHSKREWTPRDI